MASQPEIPRSGSTTGEDMFIYFCLQSVRTITVSVTNNELCRTQMYGYVPSTFIQLAMPVVKLSVSVLLAG